MSLYEVRVVGLTSFTGLDQSRVYVKAGSLNEASEKYYKQLDQETAEFLMMRGAATFKKICEENRNRNIRMIK